MGKSLQNKNVIFAVTVVDVAYVVIVATYVIVVDYVVDAVSNVVVDVDVEKVLLLVCCCCRYCCC